MSRNYLKDAGQREEAEKHFWNQGQQRPQRCSMECRSGERAGEGRTGGKAENSKTGRKAPSLLGKTL